MRAIVEIGEGCHDRDEDVVHVACEVVSFQIRVLGEDEIKYSVFGVSLDGYVRESEVSIGAENSYQLLKWYFNFTARISRLLHQMIYNNNDTSTLTDEEAIMAAVEIASSSNNNGGLDPSLDDPSGYTLYFLYGDTMLKSIMESEPMKAFEIIKHYVYESRERSVTMSKNVLRITIQETHNYTRGSVPNLLKVVQLLLMLEEKGYCNELVETRMEIILPPMMERVQRLIDRRVVNDDIFLHLTMKMILWCVVRRPFARTMLLSANNGNNVYDRNPEWTAWNKLWKAKKKADDKEEKKRKEFEESRRM